MTGGPFAITKLTSSFKATIIISTGPNPLPPLETHPMTQKQIRDLQAFAVELAKEGRKEAAKEVLALIAHA